MSRKLSQNEGIQKLKKILLRDYHRRTELEKVSLRTGDTNTGASTLKLESVTYDNKERKYHHTDKYEMMDGTHPTPVFRRGQPFSLYLHFNRYYKPEDDIIYLTVLYGPSAKYSQRTKVRIPLSENEDDNKDHWSMWIEENNGPIIKLKVRCPAKSQVGLWRFVVDLSAKGPPQESKFKSPENIFYILFNPWCEDDEVYLDSEEAREEYVLCDYGQVYTGTYKQPISQRWVYGQFDYCVLPAIVLLLEHYSDVRHSDRGSATLIARTISAQMNTNIDGGLLAGCWGADFSGGTSPEAWTGSTAIFEEYLKNGGAKSVKYGQCWVFSGCVTTACRALGIPCRSITCFGSAHDTDNTLTIDSYFDKKGNPLGSMSSDSIWNFHCWNEAWFSRPDLTPGYDGWQVIDGTPQEKIDGQYRLGPAPVTAVREGDVGLNYDVTFVFAEVNADVCSFRQDSKSEWGYSLAEINTQTVGNLIVTQRMHNNKEENEDQLGLNMENITNLYKYPEASYEERDKFYKALRQIPKAQKFYKNVQPLFGKTDVVFTLNKITSLPVGLPFDVTVTIKNDSKDVRTVDTYLSVSPVIYNGTTLQKIKQGNVHVAFPTKEEKSVTMSVSAEDYLPILPYTTLLKMTTICQVNETDQFFTGEDVFQVIKTELVIEVPIVVKINTTIKATFSFQNPLPNELTNCQLTIEGPGLMRPKILQLRNVPAEGKLIERLGLLAKRGGRCVLVGIFSSDQLTNVKGSAIINVV